MDDLKSSDFSHKGAVDSLSLQELVTLRNHQWQQRQECSEAAEGSTYVTEDVKEEEDSTGQHEEEEEQKEEEKTFVKFYSTLQGQSCQMRETWKFMQTLYTTDKEYEEERLPLLFLEFAGRLQKKLLRKMLVSENYSSYDDVEWSSWQNLILEISAHEDLAKAIVAQNIGQITQRLHEQHILALPPLAWDGGLGVDEKLVINALLYTHIHTCTHIHIRTHRHTHTNINTNTNTYTLPKWQENNLVSGGHGRAAKLGACVNWVDWLCTSADKRMWSGRRAVVMVR